MLPFMFATGIENGAPTIAVAGSGPWARRTAT